MHRGEDFDHPPRWAPVEVVDVEHNPFQRRWFGGPAGGPLAAGGAEIIVQAPQVAVYLPDQATESFVVPAV